MNLNGNEGKVYSSQDLADGVQNYNNTFSQHPKFISSKTFGEKFLKSLMRIDGSKGIKIQLIFDANGEPDMVALPVDKYGHDLPIGDDVETQDDGPKCPPSC